MELKVREIESNDIEKVVDYFVNADAAFLKGMGADKSKLPKREAWIEKFRDELNKAPKEKEFYYIIWLIDDQPVGHSNINKIDFGNSATMHLHLWKSDKRRNGLGLELLKLTIPYYFKNFRLKKLICEPKANNLAPNRTLEKLHFELVRTYDTTPGWINFYQTVNRYELKKKQLQKMKSINYIRKGEGENYNYAQDHCFIKLSSRDTNGELCIVEDTLKPGFHLARHHHKVMTEVFYMLEGEMELVFDDQTIILKEGDAITVQPNAWHEANCKDGGKMLTVFKNGQFDIFLEGLSKMTDDDFSNNAFMKSYSEKFDIYEE